jgi:hypothetical protein
MQMSCSEDKVILIAALKEIEWSGGVSPKEYPTCPSCLEEKYARLEIVGSPTHHWSCQLKAALRLE